MLKIIEGMPEDVVGVDALGKVTGEDYDNVLIPMIEEKLLRHEKLAPGGTMGTGALAAGFGGFVGGPRFSSAQATAEMVQRAGRDN